MLELTDYRGKTCFISVDLISFLSRQELPGDIAATTIEFSAGTILTVQGSPTEILGKIRKYREERLLKAMLKVG